MPDMDTDELDIEKDKLGLLNHVSSLWAKSRPGGQA